ncbi:MAG TPA: TonB-dependent receptor [Ignavibacteriaceae bacterium]|nr:TonB-dependent receptor [Ignavibacteriaceae bacterium]
MKKIYLLFLFIVLTNSKNLFAQRNFEKKDVGMVAGRVLDNDSKAAIEYANIVLLSIQDSTVITGTVTDVNGQFRLGDISFGKYLLDVRFIGYQNQRFDIELTSEKRFANLGDIMIKPDALQLNDVVIEGERSPVSYQIDKKVIDVDKMQTVISGNAADVLQNVPSVTVDIDGNVSLRGSSNFTVLIDGRPSIISAQDALQQIPANSIQNIEIITNPSAKYNPEGTAGIINIILKKNQNLGLSGTINTNVGLNEKYGGDFLFQYKTSDITYVLGMDYNKRISPGTRLQENTYLFGSTTSFINSSGDTEWGRIGLGVRAGMEFNLGESEFINLMGRYGTRNGLRNFNSDFENWTNLDPSVSTYKSISTSDRVGDYAGANLTYIHKFEGKGHEIKTELNFGYDNGDDSTITESISNGEVFYGQRTNEFGPSRSFQAKIDYTLPLTETRKFEAGYAGDLSNNDENNELLTYDTLSGVYQFQPLFSNLNKFKTNNQALYGIYSDQFGDFGIQGGFRSEYTYRSITLLNTDENFTIDRWDYFPTLHSSYKFSEGTQLMASYTRRIQRPRGWDLEPFITWIDANNVRVGNPDLLPELIDSYEAGVQTYLGSVSISAEVYHRFTNNKVDRIRSVYEENVSLNSVANIGKDFSTGSEFMFIFDLFKFWNVNAMANIYDYRIEGVLYGEPFSRKSFNWNSRLNNVFKLGVDTQLQLNLNYNSPTVSSQGTWEESYSADISAKQDFLEKMLSLTLQVQNIFGTSNHAFSSSGPDFSTYNSFKRESPIVMLSVRLNFNNYKPKKDPRTGEGMMDGGEEF